MSETPGPLRALRQLYLHLPPRHIRWETDRGRDFLLVLAGLVDQFSHRQCANAIGTSTSAVYAMLQTQVPRQPRPWPSDDDLRRWRTTWDEVRLTRQVYGDKVTRTSRTFARVHAVLSELLNTYDLAVLAAALPTEKRTLERFTLPPVTSPRQVASDVHTALTTTQRHTNGPNAHAPRRLA